jgi:hypothetical protein
MAVMPTSPWPQGQVPESMESGFPDRLPELDRGAHLPGSGRACAMEAASWLAGERWSDHPRSVNPAIASVARWVNDVVDDHERQQLWPLILASLGTASGGFRTNRRLRRLTREAGCRAAARGRPADAWMDVLTEHARLTGHQPVTVSGTRIAEFGDHLHMAGSS